MIWSIRGRSDQLWRCLFRDDSRRCGLPGGVGSKWQNALTKTNKAISQVLAPQPTPILPASHSAVPVPEPTPRTSWQSYLAAQQTRAPRTALVKLPPPRAQLVRLPEWRVGVLHGGASFEVFAAERVVAWMSDVLPGQLQSNRHETFQGSVAHAISGIGRVSKEVVGIHVLLSRLLFGDGTPSRLPLRVSLAKSTSAPLRLTASPNEASI